MTNMKQFCFVVLALILAAVAPQAKADPVSNFSATAPTQYEDGNMIPATDVLSYTLYCSDTLGGPYLFSYDAAGLDPGTQIDIATCVQGVPGTYYFVATATSGTFSSESANSNEATRTYSAIDLGKTPLAPTLFTVQ